MLLIVCRLIEYIFVNINEMANDIKTRFGKNVRKYRKILGVSQEELAFISGLHRTYISSVENGRRNVSLEAIEKLTDALKIDINKLFDE